ncbi:ArdC family protein [Butyrivibrio sp. LC3010]|uniref:ArdC family protein n=1 Tax=Butyrivibrio sp. LC3010 TaxID=1280680 RepID=UPI0004169FAC|nr:ArdC family protein [Butyrivibrio sp. LC3010]
MAFDKNNFDPKAAAEARKKEMDEITVKLEKGVKDIFTTESYKDYLNLCAKLPRYSVNNQILIMMQKPEATMCQSFSGWKEMNRHVLKGEKGIRILAPAPYKMEREQDKLDGSGKPILDKDGEPVKEKVEVTINAFKPVSTFDVSQTDGDPIPTIGVAELTGTVDGYKTLLDALKDVIPVPITFENIESGAKGYFHVEDNRIAVQEGMSEAQTVKTILHEAAHQALHSKEAQDASSEQKSKNQKETEAESVAYIVCQHYGIDTSDYSFGYVAGWSEGKELPELKASLDTIRKTASDLIVKIDEKVQAIAQVQDMDKFMEAHGDELPFDDPEADQPTGFIKITPPVDFGTIQRDRKITVTAETKVQSIEKADKTKEKTSETKADKKQKAKKISVKEKLSAEKAKVSKNKKPKTEPKKDLQAAM